MKFKGSIEIEFETTGDQEPEWFLDMLTSVIEDEWADYSLHVADWTCVNVVTEAQAA